MAIWDNIGRFFSRIVSNIFGPREEPPEREERPTPIGPDFFPPPGEDYSESQFRDTWEQITGQPAEFSDYEDWKELFLDTGVELLGEPPDRIEEWWDDFLRAFYLVSDEAGHIERGDYYAEIGLGADRIDWDHFREIRRGTP